MIDPGRSSPSSPSASGGRIPPVARVGILVVSLLLFAFSLVLVKTGAGPLAPVIRDFFHVNGVLDAMGLGWAAAIVSLSGSPVAATSLAFFQAGVLNPVQTFAMIAGSRLGASVVVLLIGFVYTLRSGQRESSLGAGLLSMLVTQSIMLPAFLIGYWLLTAGSLGDIRFTSFSFTSPLDLVFGPILTATEARLPPWGFFPVGFAVMIGSFWLFDQALPQFHLGSTQVGRINRLLYRPGVTFLLGAAVTAVTMSVSVSLGMLIPLSNRGFIRQENVIPYIMGANVTTFIDTLVAAGLLANPEAATIVIVQMVSVALISLSIILLAFPTYDRVMARLTHMFLSKRGPMLMYLAVSIGLPFVLLLVR
jgi:sodium-dependent phosphate cotransporter